MTQSHPTPGIAPTDADLAQSYHEADPQLALHRQAEAVLTGSQGITVLTTETGSEGERTALIRLCDDGSVTWERRYEPACGAGRSLAERGDASFVIAGDLRRSAMAYQGHLLQVDRAGTVVAAKAIGPPGLTGLVCVVVLTDGVTVAGGIANGQAWLIRADGASQSDIELPGSCDVLALAARPSGGFAATCVFDESMTTLGRARVMAWSADGTASWQTDLPSCGRGELTRLATLPDGGFAAVGHYLAKNQTKARLWVARLDAEGAVAWQRSLGPIGVEQRGRAIVVLADGSIVAAGDFVDGELRQARMVRLDASGATLWERSLGADDRYTIVRGVASTPVGLILVGSANKGDGKTAAWVSALDAEGHQTWERTFPPSG